MKTITASIHLHGGRLLTAANASKITARATRPTDRCGNTLPTPIERYRNDPPYFQQWVIKKETRGFIFREISNGLGICGHHPSIRALVTATLCGGYGDRNIVVEAYQ